MAGRPVVALINAGSEADSALASYLERRGNEVREAREDWEVQSLLSMPDLDVVVIDRQTPGVELLDILRRHAPPPGPFFVVTMPVSDYVDKILALELGAADVVEKPANLRELATRVSGLLARRGRASRDFIMLERTTVDLRAALVMHESGDEEQLSPGQIALMRYFAENPNRVLLRDDIIAAAPAESSDAFDRSIDSRIVRLRRKLDTDSIVTVRGTGYRFDPPPPHTHDRGPGSD